MTRHLSPQACAQARESVSLDLDGGLSRLELARLRAHTSQCAECRAFEAGVRGTTEALRAAPLEQLARPTPVPKRRRRVALRRPVLRLAAPAFAALAAGAVLMPTLSRDGRERILRTTPISVQHEVDALRQYQRTQRGLRLEQVLGPSLRFFQRPTGLDMPPPSTIR